MKTIVILGGGYAGVAAAKGLLKEKLDARIILIDQSGYHALPSDYYELATAALPEHKPINWDHVRGSAAIPLRELFKDTRVEIIKDRIEAIDMNRRTVTGTTTGTHTYDIGIMALGSETNFYTIPHLQDFAYGFKTLNDVLHARNTIDELFARKAKHEPIRIVIGGGGFTGCEFAAELVGFIKNLLRHHKRPRASVSVTLIEANNTLLPGGSAWLQENAKMRLEKLGVALLFGKPIISVNQESVSFDDSSLPYDALFWTAGVKANALLDTLPIKKEKGSCVGVDQTLRIPDYPDVFVIGDSAHCPNPITGKAAPMTGQVAMHHGAYVARAIARLLSHQAPLPYVHHEPLLLVSLGGKYALLDLGWTRIRGFLGWILKRLALLRYLLTILPLYKIFPRWLSSTYLFTKND
jgi:NADH dehydrogenase